MTSNQTIDALDRPSNPWIVNGKELLSIHSAICDALNWSQYNRWTSDNQRSFRSRFSSVSKVTKSTKILALANRGLELVALCESIETK